MTGDQLPLDYLPHPARPNDRATSQAAARDLDRAMVSERCARYLFVIYRAGVYGATRDEIAAAVGAHGTEDRSLSRRITDLSHACLVEDSGRTRPGESGRQQVAWVCTRYGREAAGKLGEVAS